MNLIAPKISFNISGIIAAALIISTFLPGNSISAAAMIAINLIALIILLANLNFSLNFFKNSSDNNLRIGFLVTFLGAIIISFLPYLQNFTDSAMLIYTSVASGLWLLILFLTKTQNN